MKLQMFEEFLVEFQTKKAEVMVAGPQTMEIPKKLADAIQALSEAHDAMDEKMKEMAPIKAKLDSNTRVVLDQMRELNLQAATIKGKAKEHINVLLKKVTGKTTVSYKSVAEETIAELVKKFSKYADEFLAVNAKMMDAFSTKNPDSIKVEVTHEGLDEGTKSAIAWFVKKIETFLHEVKDLVSGTLKTGEELLADLSLLTPSSHFSF